MQFTLLANKIFEAYNSLVLKKQIYSVVSIFITLAILLLPALPARAVQVELDTTFSSNGYDIVSNSPVATTNDVTYDMAVQSDDKVLLAGYRILDPSGDTESVIRRYNANGSIDASFGTNGVAGTSFDWEINGIALQSDGKILVSGKTFKYSAAPGGYDFEAVVMRLNSNGSLDTSFSTDGYEVFDGLNGSALSNDVFHDVSIAQNGDILLSGESGSNGTIVRLNTSGAFVTGFGANGVVETLQAGIGGNDDIVRVYEKSDGTIFAGVTIWYSSNFSDAGVWKFNADGSADTSFSGDGFVSFDGIGSDSGNNDSVLDIAIDGEKIVFTGTTKIIGSSNTPGYVARLTATGTADSSFGTNGFSLLPEASWAEALTISGGLYYLAGTYFLASNSNSDAAIWRYLSNGLLDTSFDTDGMLQIPEIKFTANSWSILYGIFVNGGEIYVAGTPYDDVTYREASVVAKINYGNTVVNLPANSELTDTNGDPITTPLYGNQTVRLQKSSSNIPVVDFEHNFSIGNVDLSGVTIESDASQGKSVVHGLSGTHSLYVPKRANDTIVIICPHATQISEVNETCRDKQIYTDQSSNVTIVTVDGQTYWKVDGLTGTGGVSLAATTVSGATPGAPDTGAELLVSSPIYSTLGLIFSLYFVGYFTRKLLK
jgi:uncharacterized delta-60 repeat protein